MSKAGLDEKTIRKAIETSECTFDTSAQTLILLKNFGISEGILNAMLASGAPKQVSAGLPAEVGIYSVKDGTPTEMGAEVVNFRTGGVGKMILTDGLDKGHVNGHIKGPHSKTRLISPLEFIIVTFEGVTPSEYVLVKLDEKSDRREFRQTTGARIYASSGAGRNSLDFDAVKLAPRRTYQVTLGNLPAMENMDSCHPSAPQTKVRRAAAEFIPLAFWNSECLSRERRSRDRCFGGQTCPAPIRIQFEHLSTAHSAICRGAARCALTRTPNIFSTQYYSFLDICSLSALP